MHDNYYFSNNINNLGPGYRVPEATSVANIIKRAAFTPPLFFFLNHTPPDLSILMR